MNPVDVAIASRRGVAGRAINVWVEGELQKSAFRNSRAFDAWSAPAVIEEKVKLK